MVQILYSNTGEQFMNAKYYEKPKVTINEDEEFILVNGVSDRVRAYKFQPWRDTEDGFYGYSQDSEGNILGYIYINRMSGEMIRMTYSPNEIKKQELLEFYYDCQKESKKF